MRLAFTDAGNDPTNLTTRQAYDLLAQGFGPGFNGPLIIAAAMHGPADKPAVDRLRQAITAHHDGVAFVAPPEFNEADTGALIVVYPTTSPQSAQTGALVQTLRNDVIPPAVAGTGVDAQVGGETAASIDAANFLDHRLFIVIGAVLILSFLLLMVVFRSLVLPLKAVIMNLFSLRRHGGGVPVGLGGAHHRHRRDGTDRPLDPRGALRGPLRPLHGL
jgi:RND superfamily putative drug exporter